MRQRGSGWHGESQRHRMSAYGLKSNLIEYKYVNKDFHVDEKEMERIRAIAKAIVDDIPDYAYHRVNFVDFMNMLLHPENTPDKLSTSKVYLTEKELEQWCIRSGRDVSVKMKHIGCPLPFVYESPFEDERHQYGKEYILKIEIENELMERYGDYCFRELESYDVIIGSKYPDEQEIRYLLSEDDKRNIADNVIEIIVNPSYDLFGFKRNLKNIGYPELVDKVRLETSEDLKGRDRC